MRDSFGGVSLCLLLATLFGLAVVSSLIWQQKVWGDVGIEPGWPSLCRCCCCYSAEENKKRGRKQTRSYDRTVQPPRQHVPVVIGERIDVVVSDTV